MQMSISTKGILGFDTMEKNIKCISDMGFHSMMLDMSAFYSGETLEIYETRKAEYASWTVKEHFDRLETLCGNYAVRVEIVRAPRLKWDSKSADLNYLLEQIGKDSIRNCKKIECKNLIVQPLFSGIPKEMEWRENCRYYLELGRMAMESGIHILLENQCRNVNGHLVRGACADVFTASKWINFLNKELGSETFAFCLDTGACNLCGQDMGEMAAAFGKHLKAVLIRECDGVYEASRLPFTGRSESGNSVEWKRLMKKLREIEFDGILIMDASDTLRGFSHLLRPQVYPLIKSVCDFFRWQIEIEAELKSSSSRVLFGAGAMCRNYMECYGEQYPPLYTCDNNPKLWGTEICGLEVKNPETLKELPEDCAVVICNMFYEEIAEQLRRMGIRNVKAFSDEC